jgi:hypothetical protein
VLSDRGQAAGHYFIPQIGAGVWVEFRERRPEAADLDRLLLRQWPKCRRWRSPATRRVSIVLQTSLQNAVIISDLAGQRATSC